MADAAQTGECYEYMKRYAHENGYVFPNKSQKTLTNSSRKLSNFVVDEENRKNNPLITGRSFVFTGTFNDGMTRAECMQAVINNGGSIASGISKQTNYLVMANNRYIPGAVKKNKQLKAEALVLENVPIEIISENVFYDMLNENK